MFQSGVVVFLCVQYIHVTLPPLTSTLISSPPPQIFSQNLNVPPPSPPPSVHLVLLSSTSRQSKDKSTHPRANKHLTVCVLITLVQLPNCVDNVFWYLVTSAVTIQNIKMRQSPRSSFPNCCVGRSNRGVWGSCSPRRQSSRLRGGQTCGWDEAPAYFTTCSAAICCLTDSHMQTQKKAIMQEYDSAWSILSFRNVSLLNTHCTR